MSQDKKYPLKQNKFSFINKSRYHLDFSSFTREEKTLQKQFYIVVLNSGLLDISTLFNLLLPNIHMWKRKSSEFL